MVGGEKRRVFCICVCLLHRSCQVATGELGSPPPDPHAFFLSRGTLLASIAIAFEAWEGRHRHKRGMGEATLCPTALRRRSRPPTASSRPDF